MSVLTDMGILLEFFMHRQHLKLLSIGDDNGWGKC